MTLRRAGLLVSAALLLIPVAVGAQQPDKLPRIGILVPVAPPPPMSAQVELMLQGLRELGYEDRRTATIEIRYGANDPERVANMAAELVRLHVAVIWTVADLSTRAAQRATTTIPIVANVGYPVESGFVASLARPGGNITAVSVLADELARKRLELLKQAVPKMTRVAFLWDPALNERQLRMAEVGSKLLGLRFHVVRARAPDDVAGAFASVARARSEGLFVAVSPMLLGSREAVVALSAKHRIPTMYSNREYVDVGGLMSYGPNLAETSRLAAGLVDKILKGAKPADVPVHQPTKFDLVINLKTAKALGLKLPQSLVQRADQVIE
jgi:putative ABC transport system substrate-binding protein